MRHAAGELTRVGLSKAFQPYQGDVLTHALGFLGGRKRRVFQAHRDVLLDCQPWEQAVVLKDNAAFQPGAGDGRAIEQDTPLVVAIQAQNQAQQRRLAATAGADDADELARRDVQVDIVQYLKRCSTAGLGIEPLADVLQRQAIGGHIDTSNR